MDKKAVVLDEFRERIISDPEAILDDREVMQALVAANGNTLGANVVDLRGIALERLEGRLSRLEDTHRSVIAAAYENLAGTNQVHRAVLRLMDAATFPQFLNLLSGDVAEILGVDAALLVLETADEVHGASVQERFGGALAIVPEGFIADYLSRGREHGSRPVLLRQILTDSLSFYGEEGDWIRSEACLPLDLGPKRLPGMLVLGSENPHKFKPTQGTDLLSFLGGVFERCMRLWLD